MLFGDLRSGSLAGPFLAERFAERRLRTVNTSQNIEMFLFGDLRSSSLAGQESAKPPGRTSQIEEYSFQFV